MRIVEVASECLPFAKTGGLGDVLGALPEALAKAGHDLLVFLPYYQSVRAYSNVIQSTDISGEVIIGDTVYPYAVETLKSKKNTVTYYFIKNERLFNRPSLYRDQATNKDYADNDDRFIFFNRVVLDVLNRMNWGPEIIHCHDWQAGLIPAYLKEKKDLYPSLANCKSVLTIHNLAYQGTFPKDSFKKLELPDKLFYATSPFEFFGKVNFLKGAIHFADKITTVSENYALEIQTEEFGCGLNGVLESRKNDLVGILNGVDYKLWSPSRDKKIPFNYHRQNLSNKRSNKVELINEAGLPLRDKAPLIGVISRLADQKGFDLIEEIADSLFALDIQMILLGTGEEKYHRLFERFQQQYPDKLKTYLAFDETLAHQIEAASDIFLMPSYFEPCGLNQMYSLKYGTVPIVRKVGGLADTIVDVDAGNDGTGFVFEEYSGKALLDTVKRAVELYQKNRTWIKIMKQGMVQDYSWKKSAGKYTSLFARMLSS